MRTTTKGPSRGAAVAGATALLAVMLTACGSSGTPSRASSPGASAPIKVGLIGTIQSEAFSFPEEVKAAQAMADTVNASGGIRGHKIEIIQCNDQLQPDVAASCGRTAVADHVSAVIEVETDYVPEVLTSTDPAHIPMLGDFPGNPQELTDSNVYTIGGGSYSDFSGIGTALVTIAHCTKVSIVDLALAATEISGQNIKAAVQAAGGTVTNIANVPATLPDYSSTVATAIGDGAQCIASVLGPPQNTALFQAVKSSSKPDMIVTTGAPGDLTPQGFNALKGSMNGDIFTSVDYVMPPSQTSGQPAGNLAPFLDAMKEYYPSQAIDAYELQGWIGMQLFVDAAEKAAGFTGPAIEAALDKLHDVTVAGMPVPVSYDTPNPDPKMSRLMDPYVLVYRIENGLYHLLPQKIDVQKALGAFLATQSSS